MKDAAEITGALPHRYPFLMVDRVLELVPGKHAVAIKNITGDGPFQLFLIEAMAQVCALAASALDGNKGGDAPGATPGPGYLAGLHGARFGKRPAAGDSVLFTVDFEAKMGGLVRFKGIAKIGEEVAAESGLTFSVPERP